MSDLEPWARKKLRSTSHIHRAEIAHERAKGHNEVAADYRDLVADAQRVADMARDLLRRTLDHQREIVVKIEFFGKIAEDMLELSASSTTSIPDVSQNDGGESGGGGGDKSKDGKDGKLLEGDDDEEPNEGQVDAATAVELVEEYTVELRRLRCRAEEYERDIEKYGGRVEKFRRSAEEHEGKAEKAMEDQQKVYEAYLREWERSW